MPSRQEHGDDEVQTGPSTSNPINENQANNADMEHGQDGGVENTGYGEKGFNICLSTILTSGM